MAAKLGVTLRATEASEHDTAPIAAEEQASSCGAAPLELSWPGATQILTLQRTAGNFVVGQVFGARRTTPEPSARTLRGASSAAHDNASATRALADAVLARKATEGAPRMLLRSYEQEGEPAARPNLDVDDTGPGVKLLQRLLGIKETGVFDQTTRQAVIEFQKGAFGPDQGTGGVGKLTWEKLDEQAMQRGAQVGSPGNRPMLDLNSYGPGVKLLQRLLHLKETGFFDTKTQTAVIEFQKARLGPDQGSGGVGPKTWQKLDELIPPPKQGPPDPKVAALDAKLRAALDAKPKDWQTAAEMLNAFQIDDMFARMGNLTVGDLLSIENGAWQNPRVGKNSEVAKTVHKIVQAVYPEAYAPGAVFPDNFGDKLGGVGAVVIGAAAGLLALRLAWPLLAGFWRQITLGSGMAKIAADVEKEEAELVKMELGQAVDRLMAGPGGRILVTYQSGPPLADRELYLTTEKGAQYAEAVSQGRNLYQLRLPERLFQLLQDRQLIELRQGSMGNQIGEDIRISPGAMQFLSKFIKEVPLK